MTQSTGDHYGTPVLSCPGDTACALVRTGVRAMLTPNTPMQKLGTDGDRRLSREKQGDLRKSAAKPGRPANAAGRRLHP